VDSARNQVSPLWYLLPLLAWIFIYGSFLAVCSSAWFVTKYPTISFVWMELSLVSWMTGGLIAWFFNRKRDPRKARNFFLVGIYCSLIWLVVIFAVEPIFP